MLLKVLCALLITAAVCLACSQQSPAAAPPVSTAPAPPPAPQPVPSTTPDVALPGTGLPAFPPPPPKPVARVAPLADGSIKGPFLGKWNTEAVFIFEEQTQRFRQSAFGVGPYFEFKDNGLWCQAAPDNLRACLDYDQYSVTDDTITPAKRTAETPTRYRWQMAQQGGRQYLVLTLESFTAGQWEPVVRFVLSKSSA